MKYTRTIKKNIKPDKGKLGSQVIISVKEDNIHIDISQANQTTSRIFLTYNQLCSFSGAIHQAIDRHYQEYSNSMVKEKTTKIYIDDPIDW